MRVPIMEHPPTRDLHVVKGGERRGEDVRRLQVAVNARGRARKVAVDGVYGPATDQSARATAIALGVAAKSLKVGLTIGAQRIIRAPGMRTLVQLARAKALARAHAKAAAATPLRVKAFNVARRYLEEGVAEVGGNNRGRRVEEIIRANGGVPGEPWCGDFVAACYRDAGSKIVQRMWASTIWLLASLARVTSPLRGHVVIYDFGTPGAKHTGLFDEWIVPGQSFWAIEGNTGSQGAVSDSSGGGDGVHRRQRYVSQVAGWRRINS